MMGGATMSLTKTLGPYPDEDKDGRAAVSASRIPRQLPTAGRISAKVGPRYESGYQ